MPLKSLRLAVFVAVTVLAVASSAVYWTGSWTSVYPGERRSEPDAVVAPPAASGSAEPASTSDAQADSGGSDPGPRPGLPMPGAVLTGDGPFVDRLAVASSTYGAHDYRVRRAFMYARNLCANPDPSGSLALPLPDPSRDWALDALAELCIGMGSLQIDETVPRVGEPEALFWIDRSRGRDAAIAAAEDLLARESDLVLMQEAALFSWEAGRAPSPAAMGVNPDAVGPVEHIAAIADAVRLAACHQLGGCGPTHWQTLEFCAHFGCAPGSNFHQALRAHRSEQRMRLIEGYARWIQGFRDR